MSFGDGNIRDYSEPVKPRLPPADSWDKQQGIREVAEVYVIAECDPTPDLGCYMVEVNMSPSPFAHPDKLTKNRIMLKVAQPGPSATLITVIGLVKKLLSADGAVVLDIAAQQPGLLDPMHPFIYKAKVKLGARFGIAFQMNDGVVSVHALD